MTLSIGLFLIGILALSCLSATSSIFNQQQNQALAQQYIPTIKYRNLVIDLGNGIKTNTQLTYPAVGKGPFPGVLLIAGSGAGDKNGTVGFVHKNGPKPFTPYLQIAQYLSERGFAVLRYDKRGVGGNNTISSNVWGNATVNDLIHDAEKALNVLIQQPEVDPKRISIIGHSEGTVINNTKAITNTLVREFGTNDSISIDKQLKPLLKKSYENFTALNLPKCNNVEGCPIWFRSHLSIIPTLSIIGNVSKSIGILLLNGENDSQTPVQQAFLLQQRLTEVNHPDHKLITYPNLGHAFYPSSEWLTGVGPIESYVLADLYAWLEAHSGISHPYIATLTPTSTTTTASMVGTNTSSFSKRG